MFILMQTLEETVHHDEKGSDTGIGQSVIEGT